MRRKTMTELEIYLTNNGFQFQKGQFKKRYSSDSDFVRVAAEVDRLTRSPSSPQRDKVLARYSYAILTEDMVNRFKKFQPILEVGAGLGYWAYEFQKQKIDYIATDPFPEDDTYFPKDAPKWTQVEALSADKAVQQYPNRTLLMCWPGYGCDWAYKALKLYQGNFLIYVGEKDGGCCASDDFFQLLHKDWEEVETLDVPQFFGLHDRAFIFKKKII
jgi:hypothetical protein